MLCFFRSSSFEPLSEVSLRQLTKKTLFLLSLATSRWVGELQAVSCSVSFSGPDVHLSSRREFRAKTESESNRLPRSFIVRSPADFVGDLPEELLLCPVRALRIYLLRTSHLFPRPRSLFVSPRSPSRSLSKNAQFLPAGGYLSCFFSFLLFLSFFGFFCPEGPQYSWCCYLCLFSQELFSPECTRVRLLEVCLCLYFFLSF